MRAGCSAPPAVIVPRDERHDMTEPRDAAESSDPTLANDPIENADNAEPTHPTESTEPTEPIESTEPLLPMLSTELSDRMDHLDDVMHPSSPTSRARACDSRYSLAPLRRPPDSVAA
jgi:hypothetical protein